MVPYQDKTVCVAQWAKTCWESYLRCFVYDAVIEFSLVEDKTILACKTKEILVYAETGCCNDKWRRVDLM